MAKWSLRKTESKTHDNDGEAITYEATIHLDAEDPDDPITLADIGSLVGSLVSVDGVPSSAVLGTTLDVALRWTDADL
jgi:hypothetical protein